MLLEIFMNVSEAVMYLFLVNSLIPAKAKKTSLLKSITFLIYMTATMCFLTILEMNDSYFYCIILAAMIFLYTLIRNNKVSQFKRLAVATLGAYLTYFSLSVTFTIVYHIETEIVISDLSSTLLTVAIARVIFLLIAGYIIHLFKNRVEGFKFTQKQLLLGSMLFFVYTIISNLMIDIAMELFGGYTVRVDQILIVVGVVPAVSLIFFYKCMRSNYLESLSLFESQKNEFDKKALSDFTENIQQITKLKNDVLEVMTPFAQSINEYEYEDARQMLEEYLGALDVCLNNLNLHLNSKVEAAINMKIEECRLKNIFVKHRIKYDKDNPTIFTNTELLSIVINLFDISMTECDNKRDYSSLYFILDTRDTGLVLQTEYYYKEKGVLDNPAIDFLPEVLLRQSLSRLGGYSTSVRHKEKMRRKIMLPYAGKAYILEGANSPH